MSMAMNKVAGQVIDRIPVPVGATTLRHMLAHKPLPDTLLLVFFNGSFVDGFPSQRVLEFDLPESRGDRDLIQVVYWAAVIGRGRVPRYRVALRCF